MTLEQKLLQYFPYQPEFILSEIGIFNLDSEITIPFQSRKPMKLVGFTFDNGKIEINIHSDKYNWGTGYCELEEVKMVLHPLSDLTKEIEVNGKKFVPYHWLEQNKYVQSASLGFNSVNFTIKNYYTIHVCERQDGLEFDLDKENKILKTLPSNIVQKLLEWHFDIHGLIEAGLAVDINTIEL